ncbi:YceI family protein, partial [Salmonella enterica subsp. enterica serovar Mbandaka]|nr:YceI family protein [Salmonella enterica subsp. enterica serovar Mbandaka]
VKKEGDELDITGNLTLNGVTKPVTLEAKLMGQGDDPWGGKRALNGNSWSTQRAAENKAAR